MECVEKFKAKLSPTQLSDIRKDLGLSKIPASKMSNEQLEMLCVKMKDVVPEDVE